MGGEGVEADGDNNKVDNSKFSKNFYNFEEDSVRLYQFLDAFQESDKVEIMTEKYRFLKQDIERQTKKLEKKKEEKNLLDRTQKKKKKKNFFNPTKKKKKKKKKKS